MSYLRLLYLAVGILLLGSSACSNKKSNPVDTTTSGSIKIAVDESLKPLIEAEVDTFEGLYPEAHIEILYMSEPEAVQSLLKDSVRMIVSTRKLFDNEVATLRAATIEPTQLAIAKDGIALILNKSNTDSVLQVSQLKEILEGKLTSWNQINPKSKSQDIEIVFDNPTSGMVRFLNDSIAVMEKSPTRFFALNSNKAVLDYVSQKPNAIGLIGVSWISDGDDATSNTFLNSIRVASLGQDSGFFKPYQAYLATHEYPLKRNIYVISREARSGLATGLITFMAHEQGQRIVLKLGLVPVTMPVRVVVINREPLK